MFQSNSLAKNPLSIQWCEHESKNNQGGLQEQSLTVKSVTINVVPSSQCCHVKLYQAYMSHVPPNIIEQNQKFYLQSVASPKPGKYFYQSKPLAVNKLKSLVSWMFSKADIDRSFTNYSLRATGVSNRFFQWNTRGFNNYLEALRTPIHRSFAAI